MRTFPSFPRFFAILILTLVLACMIFSMTGCYSAQKAKQQTERALEAHPEVVAKVARDAFPCITTNTDSSAFIQSIKELDSLLKETKEISQAKDQRVKEVRDSLEAALNDTRDTLINDCGDENRYLLDYASKVQVNNESLKKDNDRNRSIIDQLQSQIKNIKPVEKKIKDSADSKLMAIAIEKAREETDKAIRERDATAVKLSDMKDKRNWWRKVALICIGIIGLGVLLKLKKVF